MESGVESPYGVRNTLCGVVRSTLDFVRSTEYNVDRINVVDIYEQKTTGQVVFTFLPNSTGLRFRVNLHVKRSVNHRRTTSAEQLCGIQMTHTVLYERPNPKSFDIYTEYFLQHTLSCVLTFAFGSFRFSKAFEIASIT